MSDVARGTSPTVSDSPATVDLSDWLTKQQAAHAIGRSTKAIERYARAGKLEQRWRPQKGSPDVAVYYPGDVAKLASERLPTSPTPFLLPGRPDMASANGGSGGGSPSVALTAALAVDDPLRLFAAALVQAILSQTSETRPAPMSETSFLTLRQASVITGLTQAYLKRCIESGGLAAIRDRGWRIRRTDLATL